MTPSHNSDDVFALAAKELRQPAGDAIEFSTEENIRASGNAFIAECHKTWKKWHARSIDEILVSEAVARREKEHPLGHGVPEWTRYHQSVWRRVNDAIIWLLAGGQRHVVKRLCLYKERPSLHESNAEFALECIARINHDPLSIAIWNDATTCADIGDITTVKIGRSPRFTFIELKGGSVNSEMLDLPDESSDEFMERFAAFREKHGRKGVQQYQRASRQQRRNEQALTLLEKEKGTDPITGELLQVVETNADPLSYDDDLQNLIDQAKREEQIKHRIIDRCLWLFVDGRPNISGPEAEESFRNLLAGNGLLARVSHRLRRDRDHIACLNDNLHLPMALPLFIRNLRPETIGRLIYGDLMNRIYLYIDWQRFGEVVAEEGVKFSWSSEKQTRRLFARKPQVRPTFIKGRVPQIEIEGGVFLVSDNMLVQMLFDGTTPRSVIRQTIGGAKSMLSTIAS